MKKVPEVCKEFDVAEKMYYRRRQNVGGMQSEMVNHSKALDKKNSRLKKLVAGQSLDMEILKEAVMVNQ